MPEKISEKAHSNYERQNHVCSAGEGCNELQGCGVLVFQSGHSPGKPGKVREFRSGQGKVRETEICFRCLTFMMQCTICVNTFICFHLLSWTLNELKS